MLFAVTDHRQIDQRSLEFGKAIAQRIATYPKLIDAARATLERWMETCSPAVRPALAEWRTALNGPTEQLVELLTTSSERATRLRQSNPFAGLLPQEQRNEILLRFEKISRTKA